MWRNTVTLAEQTVSSVFYKSSRTYTKSADAYVGSSLLQYVHMYIHMNAAVQGNTVALVQPPGMTTFAMQIRYANLVQPSVLLLLPRNLTWGYFL